MPGYPGSFSGSVRTLPNSNVDHNTEQCLYISVVQSDQVLASTVLPKVGHLIESEFALEFEYASVSDPCQLIFELQGDDAHNRNLPVEISKLEIDDLYLVPRLKYIGQVTVNNEVLDTGNTLWCTGKLVYNFLIPVSQMVFGH